MTDSGNKYYLECPGAQLTIAEREYIKSAAEQITEKFPDPTFVNLGVMWGASMHCLRAGSEEANLVGVDMDFDTHQLQRPDELGVGWEAGGSAVLVAVDSAMYGNMSRVSTAHIVFVDADHSYESVKADIEAWSPHVVSGGLMIFHDYAPTKHNLNLFPEIAGVKQAVDEWYITKGAAGEDWFEEAYGMLADPPDSLFVVRK